MLEIQKFSLLHLYDFRKFFLKNQEHGEDKIICPDIRSKGSVIIFPSFNWHRVQPVTNGTRYSLVMWTLGKPWR